MNQKNVFINCPFDNNYFILLKPLLFTLIYIDLRPQIAETSDSGEIRLLKIKKLIASSKYSIHDLSRMEPLNHGALPRFNMAFECGIDFGFKLSASRLAGKKFLILDKEPFRYQRVISDIAGNDIKAHANHPEKLIKAVRDWFKQNLEEIPWYKEIWLAYVEFEFDYNNILTEAGYDPHDINAFTFSDTIDYMRNWIPDFKEKN